MNNQLIKIKEILSKYNTVYKKLDMVLDMVDSFNLNKKDIKFLVPEVKMFDDIVFKPHHLSVVPGNEDAIMGVLHFDNGYFASVVGGGMGLYGDGVITFEIGFEDLETGNIDVIGWLSKGEISDEMIRIQALPPKTDQ